MFEDSAFDAFFVKTVETLRPYLVDLVCIGGCANALYRHHPSAAIIPFRYLGTKDSDWATPLRIPRGDRALIADLMRQADYTEEIIGTDDRPVVKYRPNDSALPADIEFLCPRSGLPGGRNAGGAASHPVQAGLMAQPLRYLDLLLHRTWTLDLGRVPEFERLRGIVIRLPNPSAYVVQKVLIRDERREDLSAAKDCYYIFEVSVIFRDCLDTLAMEYRALEKTFGAWARKFKNSAAILFAGDSAEGPALALKVFRDAQLNAGRNQAELTAEMICRSVSKLLDAMKEQ